MQSDPVVQAITALQEFAVFLKGELPVSRELDMALTKLEEAQHWLAAVKS